MRTFFFLSIMLWSSQAPAGLVMTLFPTGTSVDFPRITFRNDGPSGIAALSLTIGDTAMHFDSARILDASPDFSATLLSPDEMNASMRSDVLHWIFQSFEPGDAFTAELDLDRDAGPATVDWQHTLFNNGNEPNALLSVLWDGGGESTVTLPDDPERDPSSPYEVSVAPVPVPEPTSLLLLVLGGVGLLAHRRKRRF